MASLTRGQWAWEPFAELVDLVKHQSHLLELFAITTWHIWNQRNKSRTGKKVLPLEKMADAAKTLLSDFHRFHAPRILKKKSPSSKYQMENLDTLPLKKIFDEALFEDTDEAGIGVVVRNSYGKVMASLSELIPKPSSMVVHELLATRRATLLVQEIGISQSIFNGDSEIVKNFLKRRPLK